MFLFLLYFHELIHLDNSTMFVFFIFIFIFYYLYFKINLNLKIKRIKILIKKNLKIREKWKRICVGNVSLHLPRDRRNVLGLLKKFLFLVGSNSWGNSSHPRLLLMSCEHLFSATLGIWIHLFCFYFSFLCFFIVFLNWILCRERQIGVSSPFGRWKILLKKLRFFTIKIFLKDFFI